MTRLMVKMLAMAKLLSVYNGFVPKFVPEGFGVYFAISRTYEKLVPLVPSHGTKVKPYVARSVCVLLALVPIKIK